MGAKARAAQRYTVRLAVSAKLRGGEVSAVSLLAGRGCLATITRIAPGDAAPLHIALEGVIDGVADALGVSPKDGRVAWHTQRERGPSNAVRITLDGVQTTDMTTGNQ